MYDLQAPPGVDTSHLTIAVVGGGSRSWARTMMNDLGQQAELHGTVRLYDIDHESAVQNAAFGRLVQSHPDAASDWEYVPVESLAAALDGADVVICSTQDSPAETMANDLDLPKAYGIVQTVGDTVGPGGTIRAMRAIPQYREIGLTIADQCPDALVLNYTNPMTVCTATLYDAFPEINAVGLCHEVYHVKDRLAELAAEHLDLTAATGRSVRVNVKGINHFTFVDEATWNGIDLMPAVDAELDARRPLPGGFDPGDLDDASYFVDNDQVKLDYYRRYGVLGAAGDRHLAEFVPWYLAVEDERDVHRWGIRTTPSEYRVEKWPAGEDDRRAYLEGDREFEFSDSGEEMVQIMHAYFGGSPLQTNVNVPNAGQVAGLPKGAVVETNAAITPGSIDPIVAGGLPAQLESLVRRHVTNQETLVAAGREGDVDRAFQAFLDDPLVTIQPDEAAALFADLIDVQRSYLEAWDLTDSDVMAEEA